MRAPIPHLIALAVWTAAVLMGLALCGVVVVFGWETYLQLTLRPKVGAKYGFGVSTPYVRAGTERIEVIWLGVEPGGRFARAGVQNGDLLLDRWSIGEFCQRLNAPKGTRVWSRVVPGGDGPPLQARPVRTITIVSPG